MTKKILISASTLPCKMEELPAYTKQLANLGVDMLHVDLMDGHFVKNIKMSGQAIKMLGQICPLPLDVHLMADNPSEFFDACLEANAEYVTIHYESFEKEEDLIKTLGDLKINGFKAGLCINPGTNVEKITNLLQYVDLVLVMTVAPGQGGQDFVPECLTKIVYLDRKRKNYGYNFVIEVDGGINEQTAPLVNAAGADIVVSGSYIFESEDKLQAIQNLKK